MLQLLWEAVLAKCDAVDIHSLAKHITTLFSNCGRVLMCSLVSACPNRKNGQLFHNVYVYVYSCIECQESRESLILNPPIFLKMKYLYFPKIVVTRVVNHFIPTGKRIPRGE